MSTLIFYENQEVNFTRFPYIIGNELEVERKMFFYSVPAKSVIDYGKFESFKFLGRIDARLVSSLSKENLVLVLMSYRLVDLIFARLVHELNPKVRIIHLQHGIYSDRLKRTWSMGSFVVWGRRAYAYIKTIINFEALTFEKKVILLKSLYFVYAAERVNLKDSKILNELVLPNLLLINRESDYKYYLEKYYNHLVPYRIVPELDSGIYSKSVRVDDSVLFIAQSLVEDGRYSRHDYIKELETIMANVPGHFNVYIKLHPRSDLSLYSDLGDRVSLGHEFRVTKYVICGYSSLMRTIKSSSNSRVFCWKYSNHHNPEFFENFSDSKGGADELQEFFSLGFQGEMEYEVHSDVVSGYHKVLQEEFGKLKIE